MRALLVAAALLAACGPPREVSCVTACGAEMFDSSPEQTYCSVVQAAEDRMLDVFSARGLWDRGEMCDAIHGWYVEMRDDTSYAEYPEGAIQLSGGTWVYGYAMYRDQYIALAKPASLRLQAAPYAHEFAHNFDRTFDAGKYGACSDTSHCQWVERGIYAACWDAVRY